MKRVHMYLKANVKGTIFQFNEIPFISIQWGWEWKVYCYTGGSERDADATEISIYLYVSEWGKKEMESK